MGIFIQHLGEVKIPEEHRTEYAQQALKLLRAGGMMTVEPVQLTKCYFGLSRSMASSTARFRKAVTDSLCSLAKLSIYTTAEAAPSGLVYPVYPRFAR